MTTAVNDADDQHRLDAVVACGLGDLTAAEREPFRRLTRVAAQALGTTGSALTLYDGDRLHVFAAHGLGNPADWPADKVICRRVIESGARVVLEDTRLDPQFGADSFCADAGVVAYAGVPLRAADGAVLGTLCMFAAEPRPWTSEQLDLLDDLSHIGTAEIVLRGALREAERTRHRIGAVVASSLDAIVTMDATGLVTGFNPAAERMFGHTRETAIGTRLSELMIPARLRAAHETARARIVATGVGCILDQRVALDAMRADGTEFPVELTVTRTDSDDETSFTGFVRDLSEQRAAERALAVAETRLALTVESAPVSLFAFDTEGRVTLSEGSALQAFGLSSGDLVGRSVYEIYAKRPDILADVQRALAGETVAVTHRFGALVFEMRCQPVFEEGRLTGSAGISLDITDRLRDQARIAELAYVDRLTRLPNRTWLEEDVDRALGAEAWAAGRTAALLFVDLDDFQTVNHSLGHAAGDVVLREAAARLEAVLGPEVRLARQGADEFLVFLDGLGSDPQQAAERVALEIITALEAPFAVAGLEFNVEGSVGISLFPRHGDGFPELLRGAESALHDAKRAAGTRMAVHVRDNEGARRRLTMSARLRRALAMEQFVLHYQPIYGLADGRLDGVEALVRWEDPELGRIAPLDFIPMAEATGLIVPIGAWVAESACRQSVDWRELGLPLQVSFNVSPVQLERGDFACELMGIIERTGAMTGDIAVEVTESVAMDGGPATQGVLERLGDLGVAVVVDDFGAGHSSLTRLRRLQVASLKIDRALLEGVPDDPAAAAVVSASLALSDALGIATVAEGVETEAQRLFLRDGGCRWAQGFGLARPMEAAALTRLLEASREPIASLTGG